MASIDELLKKGLMAVGDKPADSARATEKKAYSEKVTQAVALALAEELRRRGLRGARPGPAGQRGASGAERRMAGGIGARKVDVTWSTEDSGLLIGISIKSINFRDTRTQNFQKNLTNRRGDMLFEAVTLHRRFPYAVLAGLFFLDAGAAEDGTERRKSTFLNAHARLALFTGRNDPGGRDEQFERLYIVLLNASSTFAELDAYLVGQPESPVAIGDLINDLLERTAVRNSDLYEYDDGKLQALNR